MPTAESQEHFDRFFDLSLDMFCIADMAGYFKWVNPTCERVLGYSAFELISRPYLDLVHPEDIEATRREMVGLKAGHPAVQFTNRYRHKEQGYRWLEWSAVSASQGDVIYAVARDVTRQRQAEQMALELKQMLAVTAGANSHVQLQDARERGRLYSELAAKSQMIELQNQAIQRELELAHDLQLRLSPDTVPTVRGIEMAHHYEPASQVGGDLLDVCKVSDHQVLYLIGDAMGHGVKAALIMSLTKAAFHTEARQHPKPTQIITRMNIALNEMLEHEFVTVACVLVDSSRYTADMVLAGHYPPIHRHDGRWVPFTPREHCLPLGFSQDEVYVNLRIQMAPFDMLFFYTDGLTEAVNRVGEMYRDSRLIGLLDTLIDTSPRDVLQAVLADCRHHCEGVPVDDDISMLALCMT